MEINDNEKRMVITDDQGNEHLVEILFTYHNDERNKEYVLFYENDNPDDVIAMIYTEDGELLDIEDDEEFQEVEEVLNAYNEDPKIIEARQED